MDKRGDAATGKHVQTSSSNKTMDVEKLKQRTEEGREEADRALKPTGLDVEDVTRESGYKESEADVIDRVAGTRGGKESE